MNNAIEVTDLCFEYEKNKLVLDNICFKVEQGCVVAILGKNGCGKSTLLDCIIGYNDFKSGSIKVNGRDIKELSDKELSKNIAYISQKTDINLDYSVLEFILFGRNCRLKFGVSPTEADYEISKANAEKCGITHLLTKDINKLSGGERQLVFIARALTQESPVIIMDEPTASLDYGNQLKLYEMIKELQKEGKTIIFTTHNPEHVLYLDCQVAVVQSGKITKTGQAKDIITQTTLKEIYGDIVEAYYDRF
ncbi:MAG: ABC transporter ATP-binding protein [Clostridia bacterium]|nr:ABC transporter ATP-binding protein [Clostridia bacterium]